MDEQWHKVANETDLPKGQHKATFIHDHPIAVFHLESGYYAVEDVCSHKGLPISEGALEGDTIRCPFHGAQFCLKTGKALCLPAHDNIMTYPIKIDNGVIYISSVSPSDH